MDSVDLERLRAIAAEIKHAGVFGHTYWQPKRGVVHWAGGEVDGDVSEGYTGFDEIRRRFLAVPGVNEVVIGDDYLPAPDPEASGWVYLGQGQEFVGLSRVELYQRTSFDYLIAPAVVQRLTGVGVTTIGDLAGHERRELARLAALTRDDLATLDRLLVVFGGSWRQSEEGKDHARSSSNQKHEPCPETLS